MQGRTSKKKQLGVEERQFFEVKIELSSDKDDTKYYIKIMQKYDEETYDGDEGETKIKYQEVHIEVD